MTSSLGEEIKAVIAAALGGSRYGIKIRLPHALVMTLLFRRDQSVSKQVATILILTRDHAINLATFAAIYKTILILLKACSRSTLLSTNIQRKGIFNWLGRVVVDTFVGTGGRRLVERSPGYPERNHHALIAGAIGGYFVWGRYSKINVQINLYLLSRVVIALGKRHGWHVEESKERYALFAALIWGIVMYLFEETPDSLHPSLKMSMDEIYRCKLPGKL